LPCETNKSYIHFVESFFKEVLLDNIKRAEGFDKYSKERIRQMFKLLEDNLMFPEIDRDSFNKIVKELEGEESVAILSCLKEEEEVTDEELARKIGIKLNAVRKILYKLYELRLASYRRIRDKNTGWFIYFWKLNKNGIYHLVKKRKELVLKKLEERLEYEKNNMFYYCENDGAALTFEEAMEHSFKCPKCGNALQFRDNSEIINVLQAKIEELKRDIALLSGSIHE